MKLTLSKSQKRLLFIIIAGAFIFALALILNKTVNISDTINTVLLTTAYIVLGHRVMYTAAKNIAKGKVFDENFLMCIATIGAYILGDYTESVAVMLFYQVGEFFQSYAVAKSRKSIKDLMDICPEHANLEKDGTIEVVDPFEVDTGDIIIVKPGEKVPLDGVVTEGASSLNMSSLTGESAPKDVQVGENILSGSVNLKSTIKIKVTKTFENSTVSKILELIENSGFNKAKSEQFITRFALVYTPFVVIAALITAFVPPIFLGQLTLWIKRALTFLVISCPCALVISVPLSFFASIGCASSKGILIKGANYLEQLGRLDTVVFDKTGTLTEGNFKLKKICAVNCSEEELAEMASAAEYFSDHPVADSVKEKYPLKNHEEIKDFENMAGLGVSAVYKGKKIYAGNLRLMEKCNIKASDPLDAGTTVHLCADGKYMGYIIISDLIKPEAKEAIQAIKKSGVKTCMLTGDLAKNANAVANELGLDKTFSNLLPQDKVAKLEEILKTSAKKTVAYVGDGINDAPVIGLADVGIAMGSLGSDAAIEAADIVICDDNLLKLPLAIKICKKTNRIVKQNVVFAIGVKVAIMALGVFGLANMWAAIFADVGVAIIAILNSMRSFKIK
ncbi:MAG: cadmium-translocating P-type ATPase [Clostridia bacterium]|nr:cadmium-translocating P-type ATPase [Clostridia bacterium]